MYSIYNSNIEKIDIEYLFFLLYLPRISIFTKNPVVGLNSNKSFMKRNVYAGDCTCTSANHTP